MDAGELRRQAEKHGQGHLFRFWEELTEAQRDKLLKDVAQLDYDFIKKLYDKKDEQAIALEDITPPPVKKKHQADPDIVKKGEEAIKNGKLGIFILAGGQGSRLGHDGPKGCYPTSAIKNKTLYQLYAERIKAANERYDTHLYVYVMTSEATHKETVKHFEEHDYYGLGKDHIMFFQQDLLPTLHDDGRIMLKDKHRVNLGPSGTGACYRTLHRSGALQHMERNGITLFQYLQIDDAIAIVADPVFVGYHLHEGAEFSNKVLEKTEPEEPVGVVVKQGGKMRIAEYIYLTQDHTHQRDEDGKLTYRAASPAIHLINRTFAERAATTMDLPYYLSHKRINCIDKEGDHVTPLEPNGYKFESFTFDAMPEATKVMNLEVERDDEFAPIKYADGHRMKTRKHAQDQMTRQAKRWLKAAGADPKTVDAMEHIEISPLFAADEATFIKKAKHAIPLIEQQLKEKKAYLH